MIPQFDTVAETLTHLASQGDEDAQAAYLATLGLKGKRGSECDCILAVYIRATVPDIHGRLMRVEPVNEYGQREGAVGTVCVDTDDRRGIALALDPTSNRLACRFDDSLYPELDRYANTPED